MDDEISLADLWNTLVRRKKTVAITTLIFTFAAGAHAFLKPAKYTYTSALEVGSYPVQTENGRDRRVIEPADNVERKLRLAYIPLARSQMVTTNTKRIPLVTLSKESGNRLFILSSQGTTEALSNITNLHQRILNLLIEDNNKTLHNLKEQQQSKIRTQQSQLAHMTQHSVQQANLKALAEQHQKAIQKRAVLDQDYAVTLATLDAQQETITTDLLDNNATRDQLKASIKRIDERERLLREQITAVQLRLMQLQKERDAAVAEASQSANAIAVLMMRSEVSQTERQLWELRNSITISLAVEREELARKLTRNTGNQSKLNPQLAELRERRNGISIKLPGKKLVANAEVERLGNEITKGEHDNRLGISQLDEIVERLKSELADMTPTAALYLAIRDIEPEGPGKTTSLVLGLLLGLILGALAALIAEAISTDKTAQHN